LETELVLTDAAERDVRRLDRQVADRIAWALHRYAEEDRGDVRRLQGADDELRLRVGDWRVRLTNRIQERPAAPPATGAVQVRVITVLRVLPRGRAYRD
jgi:mRNA-degrading endonuclease RelE of RelBE toxin-antitoxin system